MRLKHVIISILILIVLRSTSCHYMADYYLRNMLDEEVSVTVKYNSPEDAQYWKNRPQLDLRRNVASQRDFKTVDALFGEKIAVNHVDPTTIEFKVPAHSMINIGVDYDYDVFDQITFRNNHYDKKLYYDDKLRMYDNRINKNEKVKMKLRGFSIRKYFFDID